MTQHTLGARLRRARLDAGMSQADLEALTGIAKTELSRYENDHVEPGIDRLRVLVHALGADVAWIIGP